MSTVNRITGFSGFDTESLVQKLMAAERAPMDKLKLKKQQLTWKQDMYRDMNKFFAATFAVVDKMRLSSNWNTMKVTSSNESTVSASGGNASGSHTVQVIQLAGSAKLSSNVFGTYEYGQIYTNPIPATGVTIASTETLEINYNGTLKTISIDPGTYTSDRLKDKIQSEINTEFGSNKINVQNIDGQLIFMPTDFTGGPVNLSITPSAGINGIGWNGSPTKVLSPSNKIDELGLGLLTGEVADFKVNGKTISVDRTMTIQDVINRVNSSGAGVRMSFDSINQTFSFVSQTTGSASQVVLEGVTGTRGEDFLNKIGFGAANRNSYGQDAVAIIDGVTRTSSTNSLTDEGVTYSLKKVTAVGEQITINVDRDVDAMINQVKEFVTKYNEMVEAISLKLKEKVNRKIQPMSDEDRKNIKEADLKLWEEEAKKGLLRSDDILSKALTDMRITLYGAVKGSRSDGKDGLLSQIGVTTSSFTGENGGFTKSPAAMDGMLAIDEAKLRNAIQENPDNVIKLFTNYPVSGSAGSPDYEGQKGLAHRLKGLLDDIQDQVKKRIDNKGLVGANDDFSIEKEIRSMTRRLEDWEERLNRKEDMYYKRFAQMEKVMSQASAQSSWIASQMMK
ncbi:flagellar filament capping protein FliD [Aneurinibacillus danicus]|uniref:Flagellar hook-associated protein 2 n=1 Tax=Aneurinibacillus danicus TaxID=267746 RepID=A0A511VF65_9BACL|nr:flagellar filament capping protein FliD [Aneurinibacillus danicus]GEN36193.1 hypothetical protein ADA01nite_36530 [Aneurinibacillus danicus]